MNTMAFLPTLTTFLKTNGCIYTVRKYRYTTSDIEVDGVGICKRIFVKQVYGLTDFVDYLLDSGFVLPTQWWKQIRKFIHSGDSMYLYRVEIIDDHPGDVE